ncbi:MAG TPA: FMN-binding negative transcriptional regulator [Archangium sp.]|nr:FMN-binding negative transcriptional regulator [Archangium sp.]
MLYIPSAFQEPDVGMLHAFMKRHSFSTVITHATDIHVSHVPLLVVPGRGPKGSLLGHLARANPHWRHFDGERQTLCVFQGPHAYISPTWYKARPAVPTWNYAVVHALGRPRLLDTPEALSELNDATLGEYEPGLAGSGNEAILPASTKAQLLEHIVGFEFQVEELVGKFKLGQNRSPEDQAGMMEGLAGQGGEALSLLELLKERARPKRHSQ